MARLAYVINRDSPGVREERLGRILAFFGVPWEARSVADLSSRASSLADVQPYAVFGSVDVLKDAAGTPGGAMVLMRAVALYAFGSENRGVTTSALSTLTSCQWTWCQSPSGPASVEVTRALPDLTGPMSGLKVTIQLAPEDGVLALPTRADGSGLCESHASNGAFVPLVSVNGGFAFFRLSSHDVPTYFCASAAMVDIDEPVRRNYYDVKIHFLSAVPVVMFITSVFCESMWRSQELGACLIIDDPLLKRRYGSCDFLRLRQLMTEHGFTTNVAFIPWNWRRTTREGGKLFRQDVGMFSVSIHGCDHGAQEFGLASVEALERKARLAQARMRRHRERTGIDHDPVMVFPQGVFSQECPAVLKRNGFVGAVNTEISPLDTDVSATAVRHVWDVAILAYGTFPIYTRRYPFHGVENFAFDLLLGKPCFIVAHHDFFRDGGEALVALVRQLESFNCMLHWRSPLEVIRRAYRRRIADGTEQVEMYGSELLLKNPFNRVVGICVHKRESDQALVERIENDGSQIPWTHTSERLEFWYELQPKSQALVKMVYKNNPTATRGALSMTYELSVATRRIFSELRDEYGYIFGRGAL